ncbi:uncharacterized protein LOC120845186 [Ixodes scapularis]|uniref:uncharacterized protein LOC120845186 n=1 Tax=Ixodes scapularis TaxID=6945 RepID=UPI001A9CFE99|nr:uncharacterized protein LOC120845186 [Ixodes scapularis]
MAVAMNLRPTDMVELLADTFTKVPLVPTVGPPPENWDKFRHPTAPLMQQPDTDFTLHELHERTMCVKAGNAVSNPRKIIRGVPQGSVVSPLLFALAIASLPAAARVGEEPAYPISMAVYADDVALWSTAPSYRRQRMVCALQRALTNAVYRLHQLGLAISAEKTIALCYSPKRPSKFMPTLRIGDTPVKLAKTATYLGGTLDSRLSWGPAMREVLQKMRTHTNILRILGGTTWGTSSRMMLQLYRGLILARPLYALPFATLSVNQLKNLEQAQRVALRICLGVPRTASSQNKLTESRINSVENIMQERAQELHKDPHPLRISLHIPELRSKKNVAVVVARQLTEDHLVTQYDGWTRVYTDGSVDPTGGTATAAAFFEAAVVGTSDRLDHQASSTTAELAAIRLALWGILTGCTQALRWVILSDSRSALELLSRLERATPLARSIAQDAVELQQEGNDIAFQWLPSHCGIRGNEVVDFLAVRAHKDPECPPSTVPRFSDAKLLVRRAIALQHPDPAVVAGAFPARVPRGFDRQTAAVIHRLRTGSAFTPAWISRFRLNVDPICQTCEETADAEHLLLHCSDHEEERTNLRDAFSRLGLPSTNLEELLRPRASRATTDKALKSVVSFLRSAELLEIL